jgi:hypothetical protein
MDVNDTSSYSPKPSLMAEAAAYRSRMHEHAGIKSRLGAPKHVNSLFWKPPLPPISPYTRLSGKGPTLSKRSCERRQPQNGSRAQQSRKSKE